MSAELSRYKTYPKYKNSKIEWLGVIPSEWEVTPLKYWLLKPPCYGVLKPDRYDGIDSVPVIRILNVGDKCLNTDDLERISPLLSMEYRRTLISPGDLILSVVGTLGRSFICDVGHKGMNLSRALARLQVRDPSTTLYLQYLIHSKVFEDYVNVTCTGAAQKVLNMDDVCGWVVPSPPIDIREKISAFLDYETARIDRLIAKQQQLIELLKEKRQAVISHVVTKGLNPDVPMKDSGVEWLGKVPEHWVVTNLKYLFNNLDYKRIPLSSEERSHKQGEYPYYGASGIIDYVDDYLFQKSHVLVGEDGANLISRTTPLAFNATGQYWVNNHAHILDFKDELNDYWVDVINNIDFKPFISGSAQPKLTAEALGNIKVAFPPDIHERVSLYDCIKSHTPIFNQLIDKAVLQISLLNEKRKNLISSAVTGKIDLRNWAPPVIPSDDVA